MFADGENTDLADRLRANVSRFAAYKADYVETTVKDILNDSSIPADERGKYADAAMNAFDRYQQAECNTATARSRTAKQWTEFSDPQRMRLFPNLRWLPSRSAAPRTSHAKFYDRIWAKDDPFWSNNTPGTEWNCKCDVEETDDPATDNSDVKTVPVPKGLEGNPSVTGEIFTDKASYVSKARKDAVKETVSKCYYKDSGSDMQISVMADRTELADNIHTGRILSKTECVTIRPHFQQEPGHPIKNPEYVINGEIADAKRVEQYTGINYGFTSAIKQGAQSVVIDFDKHFTNGKPLNVEKIVGRILWRKKDFESKKIKECFLVYQGQSVKITLKQINKDTLKDIIKRLNPPQGRA